MCTALSFSVPLTHGLVPNQVRQTLNKRGEAKVYRARASCLPSSQPPLPRERTGANYKSCRVTFNTHIIRGKIVSARDERQPGTWRAEEEEACDNGVSIVSVSLGRVVLEVLSCS